MSDSEVLERRKDADDVPNISLTKSRSQTIVSDSAPKKTKAKKGSLPTSTDESNSSKEAPSPIIKRVFRHFAKIMSSGKREEEPKTEEDTTNTVLDVHSFDDLPKDLQKMIRGAKISRELIDVHFDILLNILQFQTKVKIKSVEDQKINIIKNDVLIPPPKTTESRPDPKSPGLISENDPRTMYKVGREEGKGGFGTVFKGNLLGSEREKVAIKVMPHVTEKELKFNLSEVCFLKFCDHPNIVKFVDAYRVDNELWCCMEYLEGGTLEQAVKSFHFSEKQIAYVAKEMLQGIVYLHSENLVHRDLKSANVMMSIKGDIKLVDFGLCVDVSDGMKTSMVGSPQWMPPEMIQRKPHDYKVDIWSLGICLMELANGHAPNYKSSLKAMFTVGTVGYPEPLERPKMWSDNFKDFLSLCLQQDPANRPTAEELLKHPYLSVTESAKSMQQIISGIFVLNTVLPF